MVRIRLHRPRISQRRERHRRLPRTRLHRQPRQQATARRRPRENVRQIRQRRLSLTRARIRIKMQPAALPTRRRRLRRRNRPRLFLRTPRLLAPRRMRHRILLLLLTPLPSHVQRSARHGPPSILWPRRKNPFMDAVSGRIAIAGCACSSPPPNKGILRR